MAKTKRVIAPGDRFGRFQVVSPARRPDGKTKGKFWLCRCDCGREETLDTAALTRGRQACQDCPSEKSPYKSRWGAGWLSAHQALAERICERMARKDKQELYPGWWKKPAWEACFLHQSRAAAKLLKDFSFADIVRALNTPEGRRVFSLTAGWLPDLIERTPPIGEVEPPPEPPPLSSPERPRPPMKNALSALRALDE